MSKIEINNVYKIFGNNPNSFSLFEIWLQTLFSYPDKPGNIINSIKLL